MAFLLSPAVAFASDFYLGGDVSRDSLGYKTTHAISKAKHKSPSVNVYGGWQFSDAFSLEVGAFSPVSAKKKDQVHSKIMGGYTGLVAVRDVYKSVQALCGMGMQLGSAHAYKSTGHDSFSMKRNFVSPRYMAGLQMPIYENLKFRASFIYHRLRKSYENDVDKMLIGVGETDAREEFLYRKRNSFLKDCFTMSAGVHYLL